MQAHRSLLGGLYSGNRRSIPPAAPRFQTAWATAPVEADYVGFSIDDVFVVGYGIDCAEKFRYLPDLAHISG